MRQLIKKVCKHVIGDSAVVKEDSSNLRCADVLNRRRQRIHLDLFEQVVLQYELAMLDFLKDRKYGDHSVVACFLEDEGFSLRQAALLT